MRQKAGTAATWRADNAGEMCTGIIFPGKCGVIEKKRTSEPGGCDATMHAPELSGLHFAKGGGKRERERERAGFKGWKEEMRAILLDAVGWGTRAMIEDPYARIRQVHKCYR